MPFTERQPMSPYLPPSRPQVGTVPVAGGRGPTVWHCPHCGKRNLSAARFCGGCGAPSRIPAASTEPFPEKKKQPAVNPPEAACRPSEDVATTKSVSVVPSVATFVTLTVAQKVEPAPSRTACCSPEIISEPAQGNVDAASGPAPSPVNLVQPGFAAGLLVRIQIILKAAGSASPAVRPVLAGIFSLMIGRLKQDQTARRRLTVGVALAVMLICGLWPLLALTRATLSRATSEGEKPAFWADLQSHISRRLGVSLADTELLARTAWGDVPSSQTPMTCDRALSIETVINQRGDRPLVLFPNVPFRGPLLEKHLAAVASEPAPFADVPLDHPLYDAWRTLLAMRPVPPVARQGGYAAPYESIRWEEWQPLVASVWRACRPGHVPPDELMLERSGVVTGGDIDHSLAILGKGLGVETGQTAFNAIPPITPSRMETFAALSRILSAVRPRGGG